MSLHPLKKNQICLVKDAKGQIMPHPDCVESYERYAEWGVGEARVVTSKKERNYALLAKYFCMMRTAFGNQERFVDETVFRAHTLIAIGWSTRYLDPKENKVFEIADSISYGACEEVDFREEVYKKTVDYFMREYCFDDDMFMVLMGYL